MFAGHIGAGLAIGRAERRVRTAATLLLLAAMPACAPLTAGRDGGTWLVALERGGRGYSVEVFLFSLPETEAKERWVLRHRPKTLGEVVTHLQK